MAPGTRAVACRPSRLWALKRTLRLRKFVSLGSRLVPAPLLPDCLRGGLSWLRKHLNIRNLGTLRWSEEDGQLPRLLKRERSEPEAAKV